MFKAEGFQIEKLKGSENFHTWKFAVHNYLEMNDLDGCIGTVTVTDPKKLKKAKNVLSLCVDSSIFVHIQSAESANEIWQTFQRLYEDKGLTRKIGLLRALISVRLDECSGMQEYVDQIVNTSNKLANIGFAITDEWKSAILLAGLTEDYRPLVLGIESSGTALTGDNIISKLIDSQSGRDKDNAFFSKGKRKSNPCRKCGKPWSKKHKCEKKDEKKNNESKNKNVAFISENVAIGLLSAGKANEWYIDSGASSHMTPHLHTLNAVKNAQCNGIITANGSNLQVKSIGNAQVKVNSTSIEINDVLHVPSLTANLLSVHKIVSKGNTVTFNANGCTIYNKHNDIVLHTKPVNGVYKIDAGNESCMLAEKEATAMLWHKRLGHLNLQSMRKMRDGAVNGIKFTDSGAEIEYCETCAVGKHSRQPFPRSSTQSKHILELIHSDLVGPMETISIGKAKYLLNFIDDFSRKNFPYFLKGKDGVYDATVKFKNFVENQTGKRIKKFRSDNGTEYDNDRFTKLFDAAGIEHQFTVPYTPQQNGVAERYNRTIVERAKCLLHDANLPKSYWAEAVNMAVHLINRSVNANSGNKTPEEIWSGEKVNLSQLKLFGSQVMVHVPQQKRRKWDAKSEKLIFVGYDPSTKGYRCTNPATRKMTVSRDVIFLEEHSTECVITSPDEARDGDEDKLEEKNDPDKGDEAQNHRDEGAIDPQAATIDLLNASDATSDGTTMGETTDTDYEPDQSVETSENRPNTRSQTQMTGRFFEQAKLAYECAELALKCDNKLHNEDPTSVREIEKRGDAEHWKRAMKEEIDSLIENETWTLMKLPPNRKAIKSKWVFKTKRDASGNTVRHKARLVAKGYSQRPGIDYDETYAPVVRYTSIRLLIALAMKFKLKIHQMDAVTAFLQGDLSEDIYLEQPEGFNDGSDNVCRLNRAIYGLKQAGRQWNEKLTKKLLQFGLKKCRMDPCIFYTDELKLLVAIYVDDFLIFFREDEDLKGLQKQLCEAFKMKDIGEAKACIGIRIRQEKDCIKLDQSVYIEEILKRFGMSECKPACTPSDSNNKLSINMATEDCSTDELKRIPYQEAVGSLLYLAQGTRPDIAFAVNDVSRFNSNYSVAHWKAVKRIFRYLRGTTNLKLCFSSFQAGDMHGFSDADWASDVDKRRSCTGYIFKLSGAAISWKSKRQSTTALSSTEAEYMALAAATQEAVWLCQLMKELQLNRSKPMRIYCDNQSAIKLAESDAYRPRSKHIDIRYHYIREMVESFKIEVKHLKTDSMVADSLTKAVPGHKTKFCAQNMGLM